MICFYCWCSRHFCTRKNKITTQIPFDNLVNINGRLFMIRIYFVRLKNQSHKVSHKNTQNANVSRRWNELNPIKTYYFQIYSFAFIQKNRQQRQHPTTIKNCNKKIWLPFYANLNHFFSVRWDNNRAIWFAHKF